MLRWLAVCIVLAGATFALVAVIVGPSHGDGNPYPVRPTPRSGQQDSVADPSKTEESDLPSAGVRAPEQPLPRAEAFAADAGFTLTKTVVIPAILEIDEQQDVASPKGGILVCIGTDLEPGDPDLEPEKPPAKCLDALFGFLAVRAGANEPGFTFRDDPTMTRWRRWREGDSPEPGKVIAASERKRLRRLQVGDWVKKGQLVALVNPAVAFAEMASQVAKLEAAKAEYEAAIQAKNSAKAQVDMMRVANSRVRTAVAEAEVKKGEAEFNKAEGDEKVKSAAIRSARAEVNKAATTLQMHQIRSSIDGRIKNFSKNAEGEAVKENESILQIQNPNRLVLKGLLEVQEAQQLAKGMTVIVEATRPEPPRAVLGGHLDAVTCVAVSKRPQKAGATPQFIISGSEDRTILIRDAATGQVRWRQPMRSAVPRAAACTPPASSRNLLLVGDSTGVGWLFNLDDMKTDPLVLGRRHEGAVNCVSFSPDGSLCATGGDDRCLCLWKTETGELLHRVTSAHRGAVTSVQFTGPGRLVSAGRDGVLALWDFEEGKPPVRAGEFTGRSGDVYQLGASPDGQHVLLDQGPQLKVLSAAGRQPEGVLVNPGNTQNFATLALFAPDGKSILTNRAMAGGLQLWRAPTAQARASELRQFIWEGLATCAAFAPDGSFAVTGTQDHQVLIWTMPVEKEVEKPVQAKLVLVEKALDTRTRQVRVWAELDNPGWLIPGSPATLVVPPQAAGKGLGVGDQGLGSRPAVSDLTPNP
jgi:WD40 repeat protein